jgi:hypothetical protein
MTTQLRETSPAEPARPARGRLARLLLGRPSDPVWARPLLWAVLILAGFLYSWDLSRNGNANTFYAAAVLSGTESWKAFFFGSLDSASFITVDKPPFAFWAMGISARIFGFNSWSLLLPQAAEGVAAVAVVYVAVRRSVAGLTGERGAYAAGLIAVLAGPAAYAVTPLLTTIQGVNPVAGPSGGGGFGGFGIPAGGPRDFADLGARGGFGGGGFGASEFGRGGFGARESRTGGPGAAGLGGGAGRAGAPGGAVSAKMIAYLEAHREGATWLVAVRGSDSAAAIILQAGGIPVMAMGGFSGTDPAPTLAQLQQYVAEGKLHYVLIGGAGGIGGFGGGAAGTASSVNSWVEQNCTAVPAWAYGGSAASSTIGGGTGGLYRCG